MFGVLWWELQFPLIFKTYYSIYLANEAASENLIFNTKPVNNPILEFPTKTQWMIVLKKLKPFSMNLNILDIQNGARKRMPRTFLIRLKTPKKRLNLTNRLSLDIGANVRTKSQPRRRFFEWFSIIVALWLSEDSRSHERYRISSIQTWPESDESSSFVNMKNLFRLLGEQKKNKLSKDHCGFQKDRTIRIERIRKVSLIND